MVSPTDIGWMVPSTSNSEISVVEEIKPECTCKLVCDECQKCLHHYICTCLDSSIKWNMCKHIHIVAKYTKQNHANSEVLTPIGKKNYI